MAKLSKNVIIARDVLERLVHSRRREACTLRDAGHAAAAIYVGGYAVECSLKLAICHTLHWDELYATFMTHSLELLLKHSGLEHEMQQVAAVHDNFGKIQLLWKMEGSDVIRYHDPSAFGHTDSDQFLEWVDDHQEGVVPWVLEQLS